MAATDPVTPEPRRFSIRLPRPLWILVTAVALVVTGTGLRFGLPAYRQKAAISEIERVGGLAQTQQGSPKWLRDGLGEERMAAFDEVVLVDLGTTQATDATLGCVGWLSGLKELSLYKTQVTDVGLERLKGLTKLERLALQETTVTNRGLEHLKGLTSLHTFVLRDTEVTDMGLLHLNPLTSLRVLYLDNTKVTDAGLQHLKRLTNLESLSLIHTQVTDAGVAELKRALPRIKISR